MRVTRVWLALVAVALGATVGLAQGKGVAQRGTLKVLVAADETPEMFDLKGLTQLAAGIAILIYSSIQLDLHWTLTRVALLLATLFSASLVQIAITVLAGCAAFWVLDSYPVLGLAWKLREFAPYPMNIFDGGFRFTFTFIIPLGFVAFYPSQLFLQPQQVSPLVYFSPLVGIGLFALTYWVWTKGVNSYTGTGS